MAYCLGIEYERLSTPRSPLASGRFVTSDLRAAKWAPLLQRAAVSLVGLRRISSLAYQVAPKPPPNASLGRVEKWHSDFQAKLELPRVLSKQWKLDNLLQSTEDGRRSWTYSLQIGV